ncbi:MAG: MATE family efflux transporter [Bacteroidota bacterium]
MNKEITRLAIPNILSNISIPLLSTVDVALMGHLSANHLGAVGIGAMIFNFIYWNFGFLRMGTTGMTAQAYGRGVAGELLLSLGRALLVAIGLAALLLLFQQPIGRLGAYLMNTPLEQYDLVWRYFEVRIWAAPATLSLYAFLGWYFGMQNAIYPLLITIGVNVINVVCNLLFVWHYGMDVDGVALGTVIAQYTGLGLALFLWAYRYRYLWASLDWESLFEWRPFRYFLTINRDIFLRTLGLTFAMGFFFSQSGLAGPEVLAINTILMQFSSWMSYGVDGFAYAAESLVGKYKGADQEDKVRAAIDLSFQWGMGLALGYSLLYGLAGERLLTIFTDDPSLQEASRPYLWWMVVLPLLSTPCFIWDGVFIGLTASRAMRNSMLLSLLVFLLVYYPTQTLLANHGLWLAFILFMVARGLFQWQLYARRGLALQ